MIDNLFLLAIGAFGWGLSLATYRHFARNNGWPMGSLHADLPLLPVLIGIAGLIAGALFATARGAGDGGWVIVIFGLLLALFWTGFLRVGSQTALFLAPIATILLLVGWLSAPLGFGERRWAAENPGETLRRSSGIDTEHPVQSEAEPRTPR